MENRGGGKLIVLVLIIRIGRFIELIIIKTKQNREGKKLIVLVLD